MLVQLSLISAGMPWPSARHIQISLRICPDSSIDPTRAVTSPAGWQSLRNGGRDVDEWLSCPRGVPTQGDWRRRHVDAPSLVRLRRPATSCALTEKDNRSLQMRMSSAGLPKVTPHELPPGSSLEISLEPQRRFLLVELDHDHSPRPMARRVRRATVVMGGKARAWT